MSVPLRRMTAHPTGTPLEKWMDAVVDRAVAGDPVRLHKGEFIWKNGAELVWECADDCPNPSHDQEDR